MPAIAKTMPDAAETRTGWMTPTDVALDLEGTAHRPFEAWAGDFTERPVLHHLAEIVSRQPDHPAIEDGARSINYGDLLDAVRRLARGIAGRTPEGAAVGLLLPLGSLQPLAMLACLAAGRPFVVLDMKNPPAHTEQVLAAGGIKAVVQLASGSATDPAFHRESVGSTSPSPSRPTIATVSGPHPRDGRPRRTGGDPLHVRQHRRAEGHRQRPARTAAQGPATGRLHPRGPRRRLPLPQRARDHRGNEGMPFGASVGGVPVRLRPRVQGLSRPAPVHPGPARHRPLRRPGRPTDPMRGIRPGGPRKPSGGATGWGPHPLVRHRPACRGRPGVPAQVGYSSTETTGSQWFVTGGIERRTPCVPVGYMLPGLSYRIVDEDDLPVAVGEIGELVVHGPHVSIGTWGKDGFVPGPDGDPTGRTHRTGDLVKRQPGGLIEHVGRKDRQMKVNGRRVEPAELEALLMSMPGVRDVVVATASAKGEPTLVAFVSAPGTGSDFVATARMAIRGALPSSLHPARIHLLPAIPRLPSFKPDLQKLLGLDLDTIVATRGMRPRPSTDDVALDAVNEAWRIVLGPRAAAMQGPWDASGGDSLGFMRMLGIAGDRVGRTLPPSLFTLDMTAARMARLVTAPPTEDSQGNHLPTVFICPGVVGECPGLGSFMREASDGIRLWGSNTRTGAQRRTPRSASR